MSKNSEMPLFFGKVPISHKLLQEGVCEKYSQKLLCCSFADTSSELTSPKQARLKRLKVVKIALFCKNVLSQITFEIRNLEKK